MKKTISFLLGAAALASSAMAVGPVFKIDAAGATRFSYDPSTLFTSQDPTVGEFVYDNVVTDNGLDLNTVYQWTYSLTGSQGYNVELSGAPSVGSSSSTAFAGSFQSKLDDIDFAGLGLSYLGLPLPLLDALPLLLPGVSGPLTDLPALSVDPLLDPALPLFDYDLLFSDVSFGVTPTGGVVTNVAHFVGLNYNGFAPIPGVESATYDSDVNIVLTAEAIPTAHVPDSGSTVLMALAGFAVLIGIRRRTR